MGTTEFKAPRYCDSEPAQISDLVGKTLKEVRRYEDEALEFVTSDGAVYAMYHRQECCEGVYIESVVGDLNDLVGEPILAAEEVVSEQAPEDVKQAYTPTSQTWTFYKFATRKGYVDIRWFGESNGYYSESVDFDLRKASA